MLNLHPASVHFPIGFLTAGWLCVVASLLFPEAMSAQIVTGALIIGLVSAVPSVATGLWELYKLGTNASPQAERILWWHIGLVVTSVSIFLASLLTHIQNEPGWTLFLSTLGTIVLLAGGFFGGKLVYQHRIGVAAPGDNS
jgi:uncharacterized membrane protein